MGLPQFLKSSALELTFQITLEAELCLDAVIRWLLCHHWKGVVESG